MAEVDHIADIKQRVAATKAQLGAAASREGWGDNARLLDVLETVEKTLVQNQQQIRRLKRIGQALAVFTLIILLVTAALIADRAHSDTMNGALNGTLLRSHPGKGLIDTAAVKPGRPPHRAHQSDAAKVEDNVTEGLERLHDRSEKGDTAEQYELAKVEFSIEQGNASSQARWGGLYVVAQVLEPIVLRDANSEQFAKTLGPYLVSSETVIGSSETDQTTMHLPEREEAPQSNSSARPNGAATPGTEPAFAATLSYSADKEVSLLLAHAEDQVANLALTTPKGDNAYETYQMVLSIQQNNQAALAGIEQIGIKYVELVSRQQRGGLLQSPQLVIHLELAIDRPDPQIQSIVTYVGEELIKALVGALDGCIEMASGKIESVPA